MPSSPRSSKFRMNFVGPHSNNPHIIIDIEYTNIICLRMNRNRSTSPTNFPAGLHTAFAPRASRPTTKIVTISGHKSHRFAREPSPKPFIFNTTQNSPTQPLSHKSLIFSHYHTLCTLCSRKSFTFRQYTKTTGDGTPPKKIIPTPRRPPHARLRDTRKFAEYNSGAISARKGDVFQ